MKYSTHIENPDVVLIGSGVMSANLGAMLKRLEPALKIQLYEVTEELAQESSHGWNNAGTAPRRHLRTELHPEARGRWHGQGPEGHRYLRAI